MILNDIEQQNESFPDIRVLSDKPFRVTGDGWEIIE
jgi:hypothetical protein